MVQVTSPLAENRFFIVYSKFRGSPCTHEAKMQAAASVSEMQEKTPKENDSFFLGGGGGGRKGAD